MAKKLEVFINPDDTIVDFSCGSNEFLPIVKKVCREAGKRVKGKAFDIITPCISEDFQQKSWFDVQPGKTSCFSWILSDNAGKICNSEMPTKAYLWLSI